MLMIPELLPNAPPSLSPKQHKRRPRPEAFGIWGRLSYPSRSELRLVSSYAGVAAVTADNVGWSASHFATRRYRAESPVENIRRLRHRRPTARFSSAAFLCCAIRLPATSIGVLSGHPGPFRCVPPFRTPAGRSHQKNPFFALAERRTGLVIVSRAFGSQAVDSATLRAPDPRLCAPVLRRTCLCRCLSVSRFGSRATVHKPCCGSGVGGSLARSHDLAIRPYSFAPHAFAWFAFIARLIFSCLYLVVTFIIPRYAPRRY